MPNRNYINGRNFEYKRKKNWESLGYTVIRASGSHGPFDLVAFRDGVKAFGIQCKRVETEAQANRLIEKFKEKPPFLSGGFYQTLEVYVTSTKQLRSWTL